MPSSLVFQQNGVGAMALASSPRGADNVESKSPSGSENGAPAVAAVATPIPLRNDWVFWHGKFVANATPAEYTENLKEIADVNTVQ
ncbi:hypothetical protein BGZ89_010037, partial [Linnemannia elongata]